MSWRRQNGATARNVPSISLFHTYPVRMVFFAVLLWFAFTAIDVTAGPSRTHQVSRLSFSRVPRSGSYRRLHQPRYADIGGQHHRQRGVLDRDRQQSGSRIKRGHRPVYASLKSYFLSNGPYPSYSSGPLPLQNVGSIASGHNNHNQQHSATSYKQQASSMYGKRLNGSDSGESVNNGGIKSRLVVRTTEGAIMGTRVDNKINKPYLAFRGIPYARPPLGKLRFESPRRHPPWEGIKMTTEFRDACVGYVVRAIVGDENCLFLNVFVPDEGESSSSEENGRGRPVVFWIHGGAFIHGGEIIPILYTPGTFTDRGVIFITIGYRLGPIGFLSTDDAAIPGNYGFKDMVMGLKWVKRNIHKFGGDPNNVNIMGQSGGGVAVHALSLSPMAKGLFNSAISMSGSLFVQWGQNPSGRALADHMAQSLDCPIEDSFRMLNCFRKRGAKEITATIQEFFFLGVRYAVPLGLVVDKYSSDPFMPEHPLTIISQRKFQPVPYIFGSVPKEMALFLPGVAYDQKLHNFVTTDWENECGRTVYAHLYYEKVLPSKEETAPLCKRARELYFDNGPIDPPGDEAMKLVRFTGDSSIRAGVYMAAMLQAKYGDAPVFVYSWEHKNQGALNLLSVVNFLYDNRVQFFLTNTTRARSLRLDPGQSHGDDLTLLFDPPKFQRLTEDDFAVKVFAASMLESFWRTRNPRANSTEWPEFNENSQKYLTIETQPKLKDVLISKERLRLFADWYDLYHGHRRLRRRNSPSMSTLLFGSNQLESSEELTGGHFMGTYGPSYGSRPSNGYWFNAAHSVHGYGSPYMAPSTEYGAFSSSGSSESSYGAPQESGVDLGSSSYGVPSLETASYGSEAHRGHHNQENQWSHQKLSSTFGWMFPGWG